MTGLAALLWAAAAAAAWAGDAPTWRVSGPDLATHNAGRPGRPFDVLLQDMDGDGDDDMLVNRHLGGLSIYLRTDDGWSYVNGDRDDPTGLSVPPGVRTTFGSAAHADQVDTPAVVAWQPRSPFGVLDLRLRRDGRGPRWVAVHSHGALSVVDSEAEVVQDADDLVRLKLPRHGVAAVRLKVETQTPWWRLDQVDAPGRPARSPLPFRIGEDLSVFDGPSVSWWAQDPHGIAWVQVGGGPEPELVVVRGGNVGQLQDEGLIKEHGFYAWTGTDDAWYAALPGALPADSGRGRGAAWVDLDADGLPELSLTNRDGPNALLVWEPARSGALVDGAFEDRAAALGLADVCSEVVAWLDLDEDGWDDQVALCFDQPHRGGFEVRRALGVGAFLAATATETGLPEAGLPIDKHAWLREEHLLVHDVDGDGHLDLLVVALGPQRALRVYCGDGEGALADCGARLGLEAFEGVLGVRAEDLDLDGWLDLVLQGEAPAVLMGGPTGFQAVSVAEQVEGAPDLTRAAVVPLPGAPDAPPELLVLALERWLVARPTSVALGRRLAVGLDAGGAAMPPGAVLIAEWADGHRQAFRVGSARASALSQVIGDLRLGVPTDGSPPLLKVRWPGSAELQAIPVPDGVDRILIPVPTP